MSVECTLPSGGKISVGTLPGRKRVALYRIRGCQLEVLAYFQREDDADTFCRLMWNVTYPDCEKASEPI